MKKFVNVFATVIILTLCGMFVIRCLMAADKSAFSSPSATDSLSSAYSDGESVTYCVDTADEISKDGYFSAYGFYYNEESGEVQLAVRWNDSVYKYTDMEESHEFSFKLRNETTGEEYDMECFDSLEKTIYNYRHLKTNGVKISANDQISAVMELRDGFESTQVLKYDEQPMEEYKLKSSLRKELMNQ